MNPNTTESLQAPPTCCLSAGCHGDFLCFHRCLLSSASSARGSSGGRQRCLKFCFELPSREFGNISFSRQTGDVFSSSWKEAARSASTQFLIAGFIFSSQNRGDKQTAFEGFTIKVGTLVTSPRLCLRGQPRSEVTRVTWKR